MPVKKLSLWHFLIANILWTLLFSFRTPPAQILDLAETAFVMRWEHFKIMKLVFEKICVLL